MRARGLARVTTATLGALVVFAGMVAVAAPPTMAYGSPLACSGRAESAVFSRWGDSASYFRLSNGGYEAAATDWALSGGASVVSSNEPYRVGGATDAFGLRIPAGASAESRTLCVSRGEDGLRFFVNNAHVSGSILHIEAVVRNPATGQIAQTAFDVNGDAAPTGWAPTMRLGIPNLLGGSGTQELTLTFTTRGAGATWIVDDVYLDPFKSY